jgi:hypothetical protein
MSDEAIVRGYVTVYSRTDGRGCLNTQASPSQPCRQTVEARNARLHLVAGVLGGMNSTVTIGHSVH